MEYAKVPKHLRPYVFKKGNKLGGRKPGKSLKEFSRHYLAFMTEEDRIKYLNSIERDLVWRMAEGNPTNELTGKDGGPIQISGVEIKVRRDESAV